MSRSKSFLLSIGFLFCAVTLSLAQYQFSASATSGCNGSTARYVIINPIDHSVPPGLSAVITGAGSITSGSASSGDVTVTWTGDGTFKYNYNGGSSPTSSYHVTNSISITQAYQCGSNPFALGASTPAGGSISWDRSTDHSNWTSVTNPSSVTISGSTFFRANYTAPGCATITREMSSPATILSAGSVGGVPSAVCSGDYIDLTYSGGSTSPAPTVTYQYCGGTSCSSWINLSGNRMNNITQPMTFRAVFNFPCGPLYSTPATISTIRSAPAVPQVGFPTSVCSSSSVQIVVRNIQNGITYALMDPTFETGQSIQGNSTNMGSDWTANVGPGNYRIKVTDGNFCSSYVPSSGSAAVVQKQPLDPSQVYIQSTTHTQPVSVCIGTSVGLRTTNLTGSTWYSSPSGSLTPSGETATFVATAAGTYTIYASGSETNCFQSRTTANYTITVKPMPVAYSDPFNSVCSGTTVHIPLESYGNNPATTYTWVVTPGAGASNSTAPASEGSEIAQTLIATSSAINVTYTITPTLNGCAGAPLNVTIPVNPAPVLTVANKKLFSGQDVALPITSSIAGATVDWTVSNQVNMEPVANGTTTNGVIQQVVNSSPSTSDGSFTYTLTPSFNGCTGPAANVNITVFFVPVVTMSINPIVKGDDRNSVMSTTPPFGTGTWYLDDQSLGITDQTITTRTPGWYKVYVTREGVSAFTAPKELVLGLSDQNLNYIITDVVQRPGVTTGGLGVSLMSNDDVAQSIQYFDDLGRPMEKVVTQGSPGEFDIVSPMFYDRFSNETVKLPAITGDKRGAYQSVLEADGTFKQIGDDFYNSSTTPSGVVKDSKPYGKVVYETSPLNRVISEKPAGNAWYTRNWAVGRTYLANTLPVNGNKTFAVYLFTMNNGTLALSSDTYYAANTLFLEYVNNTDGHVTMEFKDLNGRLVCKKVQNNPGEYAVTHYVYDVSGNLVAVVPPQALVELGLN